MRLRLLIIGAIAGYIGSMFVFATLGRAYGCGVILLTFGAAWVGHTERSRHMVGRLMELAEQHFGSAKAAASHCGVSAPIWSRWRAGVEQASMPRLTELPDAVWDAWWSESYQSRGGVAIESGRVADMTQAVRGLTAELQAHGTFTITRQRSA